MAADTARATLDDELIWHHTLVYLGWIINTACIVVLVVVPTQQVFYRTSMSMVTKPAFNTMQIQRVSRSRELTES